MKAKKLKGLNALKIKANTQPYGGVQEGGGNHLWAEDAGLKNPVVARTCTLNLNSAAGW